MTPGPTAGAATMRQCPCSSIHRHMPHPAVAGLGAANCRPLAAPANCVRQRRWRAPAAAATDGASSEPAYPYTSSDGRSQKAVLEHIFGPAGGDGSSSSSSSDRAQAPWAVGWQMSERNIAWNDDLKLRLVKRMASQELGLTEAQLEERLQALFNLLPDLADRLIRAPPKRVAQLATSTDVIAARLLRLRELFPKANASALVGNRLTLLLEEDLDEVAAAAGRLRALLPLVVVDTLVERFPQVLDVDDFELAMQDAKRLMPQLDVAATLRSNPQLVLEFQKGKNLIPYDPGWPVQQP